MQGWGLQKCPMTLLGVPGCSVQAPPGHLSHPKRLISSSGPVFCPQLRLERLCLQTPVCIKHMPWEEQA